jgi:hypothetical protein
MNVHIRVNSRLRASKVFDAFWRFAAERQNVFFRRVRGEMWPWTSDRILQAYKFTNAYRASDRVSQYLIRNVIYKGDQSPDEVFFRILLFKIFNKISTWELLCNQLDELSAASFPWKYIESCLTKAMNSGGTIFSAAYIMPSGTNENRSQRKHTVYLRLLRRMLDDELPARLVEARSMAVAFQLLLSYPLIGPFLAYQFVTDLNYSNMVNFDEMEFTCAGPGAISGIRKCFLDTAGYSTEDVIRFVAEAQEAEFERRGIRFLDLWGRPLQLIDIQNVFCEIDKYARLRYPEVVGKGTRTRIKQKFRPTSAPLSPWYPPKWQINGRAGVLS